MDQSAVPSLRYGRWREWGEGGDATPLRLAPDAIRRAMAALPSGQSLNNETGAGHAACFARPDGELLAVRETA